MMKGRRFVSFSFPQDSWGCTCGSSLFSFPLSLPARRVDRLENGALFFSAVRRN